MQLILDIEVVPNVSAEQIAEIAAGITAPENYKKPKSIAEWEANNKQALVDEAVHKACFDGATGKIIVLGWAWNDEPVTTIYDEEPAMLGKFFENVRTVTNGMTVNVIGHNVAWDVRYIWQRCVINKVKPPSNIKWNGKPWDYQDTMLMWNPDAQRRTSLDKLCKALGVPTSKGDLDGSKVWQAWKDGRIAEIANYCGADVEATRACYRRMTFST